MKDWVSSSTSEQDVAFIHSNELECQEVIETYEGKDIKKAVLERTADGKLKSISIDFVV